MAGAGALWGGKSPPLSTAVRSSWVSEGVAGVEISATVSGALSALAPCICFGASAEAEGAEGTAVPREGLITLVEAP